MALNSLFPQSREVLANYDWAEFLEGNGLISFYGAVLPGKTTKYEYFEGPRDSLKAIIGATWTAQTFTIGTLGTNEDFYLNKIHLDSDEGGANIFLEIRETTGGVPNSTILGKFIHTPLLISNNGNSPEWYEFDLADLTYGGVIKLSASTTYALVMHRDGASTTNVGFDSTGTYTGGSKYDSADGGSSWTIDTGADIVFRVFGNSKNPYILTSKSITSSLASTSIYTETHANQFTELGSIYFEGKINKSAIIDGDAMVVFTLASVNVQNYYTNIEIYHVSSGETKIGEATSWTNTGSGAVEMELDRTKISPGDFIKVKFVINYVEPSADATTKVTLSHSGSNLIIHIPFKTEL